MVPALGNTRSNICCVRACNFSVDAAARIGDYPPVRTEENMASTFETDGYNDAINGRPTYKGGMHGFEFESGFGAESKALATIFAGAAIRDGAADFSSTTGALCPRVQK